jgi:hypothetical protein
MPGPQRLPPEMAGRNFKRPSLACQARNLTHLVRPLEPIAARRAAVSPICLGLSAGSFRFNPNHWALSQPAPGHAALCIVQYAVIEACQLAGTLIDGKTSSRSIVASGLPRRIS